MSANKCARGLALSLGAGYVSSLGGMAYLASCGTSTSKAARLVCFTANQFFNPTHLYNLFYPAVELRDRIQALLTPCIPSYFFPPSNQGEIIALNSALAPRIVRLPPAWQIGYQNILKSCVSDPKSVIPSVFAEELVFRCLIQKVALIWIANRFQGRIKEVLSYQTTRIALSAFLFALAHYELEKPLLTHVLSGALLGILLEKHGLWAATACHGASNFLSETFRRHACTIQLAQMRQYFGVPITF